MCFKSFSLFAILLALLPIAASAQDAPQCSDEELAAVEQCVEAALLSCTGTSACTARQVRIDDVVETAEQRCAYLPDGTTRRSEGRCRACMRALARDLRLGASRLLFPSFVSAARTQLLESIDLCEIATGDEGNSDFLDRFCERFPNSRVCNSRE